jgi:HPt (histidine-containing phosphotransfer) domain-containing protein
MQVNISRIEEIVGNDQDMKKTLLEMFVKSCEKSISAMQKSLDIADATLAKKEWHDVNHDLKGASLNLGFTDLAALCASVENSDLNLPEKQNIIEQYISAKNQVSEILKSL